MCFCAAAVVVATVAEKAFDRKFVAPFRHDSDTFSREVFFDGDGIREIHISI
jgi:hypothetical protein